MLESYSVSLPKKSRQGDSLTSKNLTAQSAHLNYAVLPIDDQIDFLGWLMDRIIINGDDYGLNEHCSKAIALAFAEGLITDTTMMATGEYFDEALILAREQGFADKIGIHLSLTEGLPLTEDIKSCSAFVENGRFRHGNNRLDLPLSADEEAAVYGELTAQVEKLLRAGVEITHADSHHYIHTAVYLASVAARVCREHGILKIRLTKNIAVQKGASTPVKENFNYWIRSQGFRTTDYFGSLRDIGSSEIPDNCEILVHPDFDKNGVLIDRTGMQDGFPTGKKLPDLQRERNAELTGYKYL